MANKRFIVKNGLDNSGDNSVVNTITNVAEPTNNSDAATKYYVDTHSSGGTVTAVTGTLPVESTGGTAPDISLGTASNGQLLIGTGTGFTKSTLTQGTGVTITNASGAITIAATGSGGDVVGPASSTDNAIVRFDLTTGKLIQNSTATLSDGGIMIVTELDTDSIKSATANSPITIAPDGTGDVHLNTDSIRIGDNNADATIATRGTGDLIITTHEGSANEGIVRLYDGVNGDITLTPNGSGQVKVGTDQVVTLVASQTLTNKTISGSSNTLSNIANASLTNSTISGVALGSNLNALTISSPLTGTSYNGSSAVSIGIPVATTSVNGYLSSTDWTTFNNKGSGSVTSVAATVPSLLSISGSPITTSGTLAITYSGTALPVANGGTGLTTLTAGYIPYGAGTSAFGSSANLFWDSANSRLGIGTASPDALLTVNTIASFGDGAVGTPSIAHKGDLNTGFWFPAADTLAASTNGTEALRITSARTVLIGGTASGTIRDGAGTTFTANLQSVQTSGSAGISAYVNDGTNNRRIGLFIDQTNAIGGISTNYSTGDFPFVIRNASGEQLRLDTSGNLGIGTASPSQVVEASKNQNADTAIKVTNANSGSAATAQFFASNGTNQTQFFQTGTSYGTSGVLEANQGGIYNGTTAGIALVAAGGSGILRFATGGTTERMRIDSSGNLGIGTASPTVKLEVYNSSANAETILRGGANNFGGVLSFYGDISGGGNYFRSSISGINEASSGSALTFATTTNGNTTPTERVRIDRSGNVGIGTATPYNLLEANKSGGATISIANSASGAGIMYGKLSFYSTDAAGAYSEYGGQIRSYSGIGIDHSDLRFYTGNGATTAERMRLDSNGDLGIGSADPSNKLHIATAGLDISGGIAVDGSTMQGIRLQNTVNTNSSLGIWFGTNNVHWCGISGQRTDYATTWGTDLRFYTHEDATSNITYSTERMRITSTQVKATVPFIGNSGTKGFGGITTTTSTSTPTGGSSGDHYYIY